MRPKKHSVPVEPEIKVEQERRRNRTRRQESEYRESERTRDTLAHSCRREDPASRQTEQMRNTLAHSSRREDPGYRRIEQERDTVAHASRRTKDNWFTNDDSFQAAISEEPQWICSSCGGLWYRNSVHGTTEAIILNLHPGRNINMLMTNGQYYLCGTCNDSIKAELVPRTCLSNGLWFPAIPTQLSDLTTLEERLVALRIPFMQIRSLGADRQYGVRGGVVNVPNDLDIVAKTIPRRFDETRTIQVQLRRRLNYKVPYMYETIRPYNVYSAANFLVTTELYKKENVFLSNEWARSSESQRIDYIVSEDIEPSIESNAESLEQLTLEDDNECDEQEENDPPLTETLLQEDMDILAIAPGEGMRPLSLLMDLDAEELSFPTIYCGIKRMLNADAKLSVTDIARSELRRYDGRCRRADKILYSYRLVQTYRIASNINICLRKKRKRGHVTAGDMLNNACVQTLIQQDDGYRVLSNIVNSPPYLEEKKKDVMAMIRQLGLPTFFITTSAAETKWPELLSMLNHRKTGQRISAEDALSLPFDQKADLIRNDPIGCVLAYDNRERAMDKFLIKPSGGIFSPYKHQDYFKRKEVQQRGSIHTHRMDWLQDAPKFELDNINTHEICCRFIDQFITCRKDESEEMRDVIGYQIHKHSHSCKDKRRGCRFGFPIPPMRTTRILLPLPKEVCKKYEKTYQKIKEQLAGLGRHAEEIDHDDFLQNLGVTEEEYILSIRSSLRKPKVFLRRGTHETFINAYNKKLLLCWRANMDIQFVLDPYACATYVVNYISKSDRGVSKLLREVSKEIRAGNYSLKERLRCLANTFAKSSEISAQEAACCLLKIPMTECSRDVTFVNTSQPSDRVIFIKDMKELEDMDPESVDIAAKGILDRYSIRPESLDDLCLADFVAKYSFCKVTGSKRKVKEPSENATWLLDKSGFITPRATPRIIRYRRYGKHEDPTNFYREQLMLYVPWRNEETDLIQVDHETRYQEKLSEIVLLRKKYDASFLDADIEQEILTVEQDEALFGEEIENDEPLEFVCEDQDYSLDLGQTVSPRFMSMRPPTLMMDQDYHELVASLNEGQRRYLLNLIHHLNSDSEQAFHLIHGQAGVGKSRLIQAIVQCILRMTDREPGTHGDSIPVLVAAATGKAAFNVGGMTLHSTFRLPPSQASGKIVSLDHGSTNSLRVKFESLRVLIIDEISLVSLKMFVQIDHRLRQIKGDPEIFGNITVLVFGDFFQLRPVFGQFVFEISDDILGPLVGNPLWERFRMFELTEIMRQKDDLRFAQALNRLSIGALHPEDVVMFQSRQVSRGLTVPEDATWLFYDNKAVDQHNWEAIARSNTALFQSFAIDRVQGGKSPESRAAMLESAKNLDLQQTGGMPYHVQLKLELQYMVTTNIDVSDGLFNGATGRLKAVIEGVLTNGEKAIRAVCVLFPDKMVGQAARANNKQLLEQHGFPLDWTPIFSEVKPLNCFGHYQGMQVIRRQIPLVPAEAITIHKSQSSTMPNVVANIPARGLRREAIYVAFSRSPSISSLFVNGTFNAPRPIDPNHPVQLELHRLRQLPFPYSLTYLPDITADNKITFHNIQSFRSHLQDIQNDRNYTYADILCFCETKTLLDDEIELREFEILNRTDSPNRHSSIGTLLFRNQQSHCTISNVTNLQVNNTDLKHFQFVHWIQNHVFVCMVYRSPTSNIILFTETLTKILQTHLCTHMIFVGDFNVNFLNPESSNIRNTFARFNLEQKTPPIPSTTNNTCLDVCFSNIPTLHAWYYESYFSYHKPISMVWSDNNSQHDNISNHVVTTQTSLRRIVPVPISTTNVHVERMDISSDSDSETDSPIRSTPPPPSVVTWHSGIPNIGNTCYITAAMHIIAECSNIRDFIGGIGVDFTNAISSYVSATSVNTSSSVLREARNQIAKALPQYPVGTQEDSFLFLVDVLNNLRDAGISMANNTIHTTSNITCICGTLKTITDTGVTLSLALYGSRIQDCINSYFTPTLDVLCDACRLRTVAVVVSTLLYPPQFLITQLKRFNNAGHKNSQPIEVDDIINIPTNGQVMQPYYLKIVVCHIGPTVRTGHYVACHRITGSNAWMIYDDNSVYRSNSLVGEGYILLYTSQQ